jgi:D-alanyl-D-alanine carboxypeptidase
MKTKLWMIVVAVIVMVNLYSGCDKKQEDSKELPMPEYSEAKELVSFDDNSQRFQLHPDAFNAWERMRDAAKGQEVQLRLVSAFRSIQRQSEIVEKKRMRGLSDEEIFKVSARPGYSEHHTGKAIDLTTPGFLALEEEFEKSEAFKWLIKNANSFGFQLSYPRDNKYGIIYEPWHWCFTQP